MIKQKMVILYINKEENLIFILCNYYKVELWYVCLIHLNNIKY